MRPTFTATLMALTSIALAQEKKPNILEIFGDDAGQTNISADGQGVGAKKPNHVMELQQTKI